MRKNKKQKGFTLIELLIVIAIIGILAAIAIPVYVSFVAKANHAAANAAMGTIRTGLELCKAESTGNKYPLSAAFAATMSPSYFVMDQVMASFQSPLTYTSAAGADYEIVGVDKSGTTGTATVGSSGVIFF